MRDGYVMGKASDLPSMRRYDPIFRAAYSFMERYIDADTDANFEKLVAELPGLSAMSPFMADMLVAVTGEISREYERRRARD